MGISVNNDLWALEDTAAQSHTGKCLAGVHSDGDTDSVNDQHFDTSMLNSAEVKEREKKRRKPPRLPATVPEMGELRHLLALKVIELMVRVGDEVQRGQSLVTLEGPDFLVEVPSEYNGIVREIKVKLRDRISPGAVFLMIEETQDAASSL